MGNAPRVVGGLRERYQAVEDHDGLGSTVHRTWLEASELQRDMYLEMQGTTEE